jgi:glycosyltransferase involved in cell wall biosynthesis
MNNTLEKPRLLIVLNRLSIGGPATNTLAIAHELRHDFDVMLIAGEPVQGEESAAYLLEQYSGFKVQMLQSMKRAVVPLADYHAYRQIKQIIRQFQPHIVHTHGSKPGVIARLAAWRSQVPVVVHTYHGHVFHSYFHPLLSKFIVRLERWLARRSAFIIAINNRLKQELETVYRIAPSNKIVLNRLGIDIIAMQDADGSKRQHFRKEFQLKEEEIAIGIIGRLVPVKQHHLFVEMVVQLLQSNRPAHKLRFFIIGDGDEKQKLEQLLHANNITYSTAGEACDTQATVIFTSWRKDMDEVMAGLDIVTLTSKNEGTPVSVMEAMAAGKPVVAADVGGIAELFETDKNGLLFQRPQEFLHHMQALIASPQKRETLGKNAQIFASDTLALHNQVLSLKKIYLEFLQTV